MRPSAKMSVMGCPDIVLPPKKLQASVVRESSAGKDVSTRHKGGSSVCTD